MLRTSFLAFFIAASAAVFAADAPDTFFENKVRPLLVQHCQECHGPEKHKGGLRLDSRAGWQTGGDSGPALVPGDAKSSRLITAISYTDRDLKMPPKQKLAEADIAVLTQWIATGAFDSRTLDTTAAARPNPALAANTHWAYQPIQRPAVPTVTDNAWPRNDIDRFVLAKLESQGLSPAPDASPDVLARRIAFDLTGMPGDLSAPDDAVRKALASTAFAEHWAQHWLDAARFAESSGGGRTLPFKDAWRYRDYVIESIRDDVPLDRFISEQIAGDLLPYETNAQHRRQIIATGFLVIGAHNYEEQDKNALRMDIVDEQLDTIGKSLLGMSIGCARCHDHKFDPIPTRDYYALAGILRSTKLIRDPKENVAHWIETPLPLDGDEENRAKELEEKLAALNAQLTAAKAELKRLSPKVEPKDGKERPLAVDEVPGIVVDDEAARKVGGWKHSTHYPTYVGTGYLTDENKDKGSKTVTFAPQVPHTGRYEVRFSYTSGVGRSNAVPVHILHADGEEDIKVDESVVPEIDSRFISLGQFRFEAGGQGYVMVSNENTQGFVTADAVTFVPVEDLPKLAAIEAESKADEDPEILAAQKRVKSLTADIKAAEKSSHARPVAMAVVEHEDVGDCQVHIRGNLRNLGPKVPRGFIQAAFHGALPTIPDDQSGRMQFARWITSRDNTLTARVLANRVWMHLFGEGIVRSADNFGVTGELPSHPELIDHLAIKLIDSGWSLKALVSYITSSRTYRMASHVGADAYAKHLSLDPDNRLFWRQNRKRMEAGQIRDAMLIAAGTLDSRSLGPTVGDGTKVGDANDSTVLNTEYNYVFTDKRRSVYTPAFRNKRLEVFDAFDFGNINAAIARRNTSAVAPQALYMLNHEFVIEQSRAAAQRLLADPSLVDDTARLLKAYQLTLGRAPTAGEARLASDFVAVSAGEPDAEARRAENWSLLVQTLFASVDFRHVP